MRQVYWLSDAEWQKIGPLHPKGRRGAHRLDDRRIISGIVHMLHSGARWHDCPEVYDPYMTVYNRFKRWSRQGIWIGICGYPAKPYSQTPSSLRQTCLQRPQCHRAHVLTPQGLPAHRHAL